MAQKFEMGSFGSGTQFNWSTAFTFDTNISNAVKRIYINNWDTSLASFVNMKITLESGVYYMNVLDNDLSSGTTVERDVVSYELPDFFPGQPNDNLTQIEFIGSDDVRMFKAEPITMNGKKWLRIATGKQFKMKVENGKVIIVYQV